MSKTTTHLLDAKIMGEAAAASFQKLDPRVQLRNPVMFAVYLGSILTTVLWVNALVARSNESSAFILGVAVWLWLTVLFANFAEAMAEARGQAQADTLRATKKETPARLLHNGHEEMVPSSQLRKNHSLSACGLHFTAPKALRGRQLFLASGCRRV